MIDFFIPILPVPKQGDRVSSGRHYQPRKVTTNAKELALYMQPFVPREPLAGPLKLDVTVYYPHLSRTSAKRRLLAIPKGTAPDGENLLKQVADVMEKLGFFAVCDGQVSDGRLRKRWSHRFGFRVRLEPDEECSKPDWKWG